MTDKLHQSLSSIMDGAGDDLELPRLLNAMQESSSVSQDLSDKWRRYHLAQGVLRGELRGMQNPKVAQVDISAAVMQQLEDENLFFTDAGAASELVFSQPLDKTASLKAAPELKAAISEKRPERGQWLRGGALAASVALLVITGTQIYNLSQEGEASAPSFAVQKALPVTRPEVLASQVASDCQSQLFSGVSVINFPIEVSQRKPCSGDVKAYSPLLSSQQARLPAITPVSSR